MWYLNYDMCSTVLCPVGRGGRAPYRTMVCILPHCLILSTYNNVKWYNTVPGRKGRPCPISCCIRSPSTSRSVATCKPLATMAAAQRSVQGVSHGPRGFARTNGYGVKKGRCLWHSREPAGNIRPREPLQGPSHPCGLCGLCGLKCSTSPPWL